MKQAFCWKGFTESSSEHPIGYPPARLQQTHPPANWREPLASPNSDSGIEKFGQCAPERQPAGIAKPSVKRKPEDTAVYRTQLQ